MNAESERRGASDRATAGAAAAPPAVRSKPIRITVDLAPELYATLTRLTSQTALDLARKLTQSDLIRALVAAADDQPLILELARRQLTTPPPPR